MSAVVLELRPVANAPDKQIVELVESFLEEVKSGNVIGIAVVAHHRGGGVGSAFW